MSDWSVDGVVDNTWSSLDEVTWIEREDKGDCIVPESRLLRPTSCISVETLRRVSGESLQQVTKPPSDYFGDANVKEEQYDQGNSHESKYISEDTAACSKGVAWCESAPSALPLKTIERGAGNGSSALGGEFKKGNSCYVYEGTTEMCNGESGYYSNGVDILNGSCNFFPSDICPSEGDLEFLAEEGQEDGRRDNLLEYGWGNTSNMEDMEKLFPSTDSLLMRGFDTETDGMLWEPPLGDSLEVINPSVKVSVSPKFASRRDMKDMDTQVHFSSGNSVTTLNEDAPNSGVAMEGKQEMFTCLNPSSLSTNMENYSNSGDLKTWDARLSHNHRSSAEYCEGSNDDEPHLSIDVKKVAGTSGSSLCLSDSERTRVFEEGEKKWKTGKARRQGSRSKKPEENTRKPFYGRTALSEPKKAPLVYVPIVSSAQESSPCSLSLSQITGVSVCETGPPLQCLQPIPYVHAGFGFPAHHMPIMVPGPPPPIVAQQLPPQAQPLFISYQPPPFIEAPKSQQCKSSISSRSPSVSSTMTPQEKIEKLRWRQKMQAQLAIEQQQQQLISQRLIPEQENFARQQKQQQNQFQLNSSDDMQVRSVGTAPAEPSIWNERITSAEGASVDDGDEPLAVSILQQLLNIASKMDTRTRLCLRDGFRRLARNAMQRRAAGDRGGSVTGNTEPLNRSFVAESSSSSEQACSQRLLTVEDIVETETNPMDRFIADFLFHKRCPPPSSTPSYVSGTPPCNMSPNSQPTIVNQAVWAWLEANPLSPGVSPATHSSSADGDLGTFTSPNVETDRQASPHPGSCPGQVVILPQAPAMGSMQHPLDRDRDMINMDPEPLGNVNSLDDVKEPLLQAE